jgi:hypothetical protein
MSARQQLRNARRLEILALRSLELADRVAEGSINVDQERARLSA